MVKPILEQDAWETVWSPYDEPTYQQVLSFISRDDIVLDIGAGDLRLSRRIAGICQKVYAIEVQFDLIKSGAESSNYPFPDNLYAVNADARLIPFPGDISAGVMLMRHCQNFQLYAEKLKSLGAKWLITNARWRLGVEIIDLQLTREHFKDEFVGEYACWCGATGFINGPVEMFNLSDVGMVQEVIGCRKCSNLVKE